jgi:pyruvate dehydrogenase E2 component (dihydrolipoamide acetyltransferase)
MTRIKQFKLPDLGEGLTEGEILKWLVAPGDEVKLNQPIVEVETAKAAVEIPSPYAGVVTDLHTAEGETVDVGTPIITFDTEPGAGPVPVAPEAGAAEATPTPAADEDEPIEAGKLGGEAPGGRIAVLVGYGPRAVTAARRPRKPVESVEAPLEDPELSLLPSIPDSLHSAVKPVRHGGLEMGRALERAAEAASAPVRAKPPVRKLARDLGLDLASVRGTGPGGTITRDDVSRAAESATVPATAAAVAEPHPVRHAPVAAAVWDASREQRLPIKGVRKLTAEAMVNSAFTAPHVTEFLTVDVTRSMRAVQRLKAAPEFADARVNFLLLVAKAIVLAVERHPMINATWDAQSGEIVVKEYVNLGIAAATPRGLIVPNVKDAGRLTLRQLADALTGLVATAKDGKTPPADMQGGTITITNVGVFGVDTGTPILNPGESAILALGAVREQPWVHKGKVKVRQVCQLALSFDHRIVDGELGSKFLADVGRFLNDPQEALLAWS